VRTYRAANVHDAEICEEVFERPKNFDLAAHWENAVREYEAGVYHEHADVRVSPKGIYMLEMLGPYVQRAAAQTAGRPDRKGWVRCSLPLESIDFGIRELMRLGDEVVVLGPPELRTSLAETARRIAKIHGARRAKPRHSS
jgi:predicted DNA-binding transcriptional regulator YafY